MSCIGERLHQSAILLKKNFLIMKRRKASTILQVLVPAFTILLLFIMAKGIDKTRPSINHPPPETLMDPYSCKKGHKKCCILVYGPDVAEAHDIMQQVAGDLNLPYGSVSDDDSPTTDGVNVLKECQSQDSLYDWILDHNNVTMTAVFLETVSGQNLTYTLMYNATQEDMYTMIKQPLMVQRAVDQALVRTLDDTFRLSMNYKAYPKLKLKIQGEAIMASIYGAPFFYLGVAFAFISLLTSIVTEKELRLRFGMKIMGLRDSVYWVTWLLTSMATNIIATLFMIIVGYILGLKFFANTNFFVLVFVFVTFQFALLPVAFLLSVFISRSRSANVSGFGVVLFGMFFMMFMCNGFNVYIWYKDGVAYTVFLTIFQFLPYFNFARCYADIVNISVSQHFSDSGDYSGGSGYHWGDLYKKNLVRDQVHWDVPPTADSLYLLLMNFGLYMLLAWYLDNTLPGADGVARPFYFFVTPHYWGFSGKKNRSGASPPAEVEMGSVRPLMAEGTTDADVFREAEAAHSQADAANTAVRILGLEKTFYASPFRKNAAKDVKAVQGISLRIANGTLFGLLGHNGAGKTTTISVLVGLYPPTEGQAYVFGYSVQDEIDEIRRIMGVCPQHDILWDELSAREHLRMFAEFKHVPKDRIAQEVEDRLTDVDLDKVGAKLVGTYSGGMKRRLSVAISAIGDPQIIFMDEPTTGMDPASRRQVWTLIHRMKEGRVVLLTTHSMEEADHLADRIGIMAFGRLQCIGDSLHLKSRFGDGYHVDIVTDVEDTETAKARVRERMPQARLVSDNAGNMIFNIPFSQQASLTGLFQMIEEDEAAHPDDAAARLVKDWGISHTTLEEVYLKVTSASNFGYGSDQHAASGPQATAALAASQAAGLGARPNHRMLSRYGSVALGVPVGARPLVQQPVMYQVVGQQPVAPGHMQPCLVAHQSLLSPSPRSALVPPLPLCHTPWRMHY